MSRDRVSEWAADAAGALVEQVDGRCLVILGRRWEAEAIDSCGDRIGPDRMFLIADGAAGRQVTVRVTVEVLEGTLT